MGEIKLTKQLIFQNFKTGFRQYPFSFCRITETTPATGLEVEKFNGMVPDGDNVMKDPLYQAGVDDEHLTAIIDKNFVINPSIIYDGSLCTGLIGGLAW
jgi:hypothetical protein